MDKSTFLIKLGAQIVKKRLEKGMTQSELARACDKEPQSIERVENGKINPSAYYLKQIADALEIPVKDIFDFK